MKDGKKKELDKTEKGVIGKEGQRERRSCAERGKNTKHKTLNMSLVVTS